MQFQIRQKIKYEGCEGIVVSEPVIVDPNNNISYLCWFEDFNGHDGKVDEPHINSHLFEQCRLKNAIGFWFCSTNELKDNTDWSESLEEILNL